MRNKDNLSGQVTLQATADLTICIKGRFTWHRLLGTANHLNAGITSWVSNFRLLRTASFGRNPPGLSSAVMPVIPSIS